MEKKIQNTGFSMISFLVYIAIVTISISVTIPLVSQMYNTILKCIKNMHHDFTHEYAMEIIKSDIICAPNTAFSWKYTNSYISFKTEQSKIAWIYADSCLYRIEKKYTNDTNKREKKIFLQNVLDISFQVIQDKESIAQVLCKTTDKSYQFLLQSGVCV